MSAERGNEEMLHGIRLPIWVSAINELTTEDITSRQTHRNFTKDLRWNQYHPFPPTTFLFACQGDWRNEGEDGFPTTKGIQITLLLLRDEG